MIEQVTEPNNAVLADIIRLEAEAFGAGGMNEWHLVPLIRHGLVFIYREQGQVAGSVQYMRDWRQPQLAYMYGIAVAQCWRGKGIASKLLSGSFEVLAKSGFNHVELTVDPANETALRLYERFGFNCIGRRENEYGPGEHRLIMLKKLKLQQAEIDR